MKGTVCWCKVLLMTLIADWNLKGLHTGQMDRIPILWLVGASEQHTGVIEKNEVGAYWLFWNLTVQYQLTVLCSQIMLVYPACQKKRGLHWTKQEQNPFPQAHVTQLARAAIWWGFGAHWELSVSVREFKEHFSLCYRRETALTHRLKLM